ncbi:hypothetical protein JKV81_09365, partial [Streptomyces sp. For3]|nr:hypothetical protein [Streptomyces silvae]
MVQGRSLLAPNERLLPTYRLRADDQLRVMRAACSSTDAFINADRLAAATGLTAKNCGLVPAFLFTTGLVEKAGGHFSRYRPTSRGRRVAAAWQHGEAEGLLALREAWKGQWFARSMKERLESGPVARNGLLARLLTAAGAEGHRMRQAEALLDVLVAIGMIFPDGDGLRRRGISVAGGCAVRRGVGVWPWRGGEWWVGRGCGGGVGAVERAGWFVFSS